MTAQLGFPDDFVWGVATSATQIEGAASEDGRGPSTWDVFCRRPGKIAGNADAAVACDHYHRYREDVSLMASLGIPAYRFSIAWPRVQPDGEGALNEKGLAFYDRLIDELLAHGIEPYPTLFHWDLPQALEDKYGGWRSKKVADCFADYAGVCAERYSDRVTNWITINEVGNYTVLAYRDDRMAPGGGHIPMQVVNQSLHNGLLGHGLAVQALRAKAKQPLRIGLADNITAPWPVYGAEEHEVAAAKAFLETNLTRLFPVMEGRYRERQIIRWGKDAPVFTENEMKAIGAPLDFLGYNIYTGAAVRHSDRSGGYEFVEGQNFTVAKEDPFKAGSGYEMIPFPRDYPRTMMGEWWAHAPRSLYYALKHTKDYFGDMPVFITENGMAAEDTETVHGEVLDIGRVEYLRSNLEQAAKAVQDGYRLKGFFLWTLMDNFEWGFGYTKPFGIVRVDFTTMERKPKLSAHYFSHVIRENRVL